VTEKHQRLCIGVGLLFLPLFWLGLMVAGWFPPPTPNLSVDEVARMFSEDRVRIRIGVLILTSAAPLLAGYGADASDPPERRCDVAAGDRSEPRRRMPDPGIHHSADDLAGGRLPGRAEP
jgi:hypothetical protein